VVVGDDVACARGGPWCAHVAHAAAAAVVLRVLRQPGRRARWRKAGARAGRRLGGCAARRLQRAVLTAGRCTNHCVPVTPCCPPPPAPPPAAPHPCHPTGTRTQHPGGSPACSW
jgi:hypothetical protein